MCTSTVEAERSYLHNTTWSKSECCYVKDPLGYHITISYKTAEMIRRRTHATCHGYTWGKKSLTFREATLTGVKPDTIIKRTNNRYVWPDKTQLWRGPDIYTGHLAAGLVDSNTGSSTSKIHRGLRNERISVGPSKVLQGSLRNEPISLGTGKVLQNLRKHSSSSLGASTMRSEIYSRQD